MANVTVESRPAAWKTLLAFGIIYFVWGSTFLAIRIGVHEVPPLLFAAMRFGTAGAALLLWTIAKRERMPGGRQWVTMTLLAAMIFLCDYGLLFWAERRVPSGIAAVMLGTIPAFMALSEIILLRTQKLTVRLAIALLIGIGGVAVQMIIGGFMLLAVSGGAGEFARFHPAEVSGRVWWSLIYLIVAGSIIGFTA